MEVVITYRAYGTTLWRSCGWARVGLGPPTANQRVIAQSREAQKEVPQTAVPLVANRGWMQKGAIPIDPHVKMPNFTAEINMFLVEMGES